MALVVAQPSAIGVRERKAETASLAAEALVVNGRHSGHEFHRERLHGRLHCYPGTIETYVSLYLHAFNPPTLSSDSVLGVF